MSQPLRLVSLDEQGAVGLIRIDNPPVNAINQGVRAGLAEAMAKAANNPRTKVILIVSGGRYSARGADINEFDHSPAEPSFQTVQTVIECAHVPVVVAMQGLALGGALEHVASLFRLAHKHARLGLPEITLGIIPARVERNVAETRWSSPGTGYDSFRHA